jgi:hypothetical protein
VTQYITFLSIAGCTPKVGTEPADNHEEAEPTLNELADSRQPTTATKNLQDWGDWGGRTCPLCWTWYTLHTIWGGHFWVFSFKRHMPCTCSVFYPLKRHKLTEEAKKQTIDSLGGRKISTGSSEGHRENEW